MDLGLNGKIAVVTGASKGIGLAVTRALAAEGVHVVAGSRGSTPELTELRGTGKVQAIEVDLATAAGPAHLVAAALEHGRIDILVNNVGAVSPRLTGFLDITDEQWFQSLTLNLMAAVRTTRAALPTMLAAGRGNIVTTSSVNAFLPDPGVIDYSAAKAALTNFSKALSKEVGAHGIRVNTISPGPVTTDLWLGEEGVAAMVARAGGGDPEAVAKQAAAQAETGRFTHPQEIADLVLLLSSGRAGNVTGADFVIDGGLIKTL
ncbi:SDR family oxidoreductase [Acrocarpospora macrocephala]|uniref:3-oxoacyl-ACP reductase n=1 Tax=Acrocarpospora macrocephala TaxID=150177 RepID=A0A5M3XAE0_9ACTN|nr:SDR family NAD(P)-dependent oxidoreductase [Acrocarpospora macrocephala]GES16471.1 3-oxoacyl-ACP reductase [Acrocarpospora macrocephala]